MTARQELLDAFAGLRVADVCDGLDRAGLPDLTLMDPAIRPLYRDVERFSHRLCGIAHTVRWVPTARPRPALSPDEFPAWEGACYRDHARSPFAEEIQAGDVLVFDAAEQDVGTIGSNNCLGWIARGARGVVTSGGARDTDELIMQQCPVYCRLISRTIQPGRQEFDASQVPIQCGGVLVHPGDIIVADGDGVVVVPQGIARDVARYAREVLEGDKRGRRALYEQLGRPPDDTVQ